MPDLAGLIPMLFVNDLEEAIDFYTTHMGSMASTFLEEFYDDCPRIEFAFQDALDESFITRCPTLPWSRPSCPILVRAYFSSAFPTMPPSSRSDR